jgi:hypothetical protein
LIPLLERKLDPSAGKEALLERKLDPTAVKEA